jgi:glycosyltransferase involved in cell wall biosynthesis
MSGPTAGDFDQPTVSFVLIAHNEAQGVTRALDSILAQRVDKEVLVVDDGSTDRTPDDVVEIARREPDVWLIRLPRNNGRGFARDIGVRQARGRFVATVDADIVLPSDWWERCAHELRCADAVGGTAVPDGDVAYLCSRFALSPRALPHTTTVAGSNGLYRRELFDQVSFDPSLREGEDIALNQALRARNARLRTVPGLLVLHVETKGLRDTVAWLFQSGRGATRQFWRYRELRLPDIAFGGWLVSSMCGLAILHRNRRRAWALPLLYVGAVSLAHVWRAFDWEPRKAHRLIAAAALDGVLLTAYFCGRVDGVRSLIALVRPTRR